MRPNAPQHHPDILGKVVATLVLAMTGLVLVAALTNVGSLQASGVDTGSVYLMLAVMLVFMGLLALFSWILVRLLGISERE